MHHSEIIDPFRYQYRNLGVTTEDTISQLEESNESIISHKDIDFWKTIVKKHRVGIYLLLKKYQKRKYTFVM
ncbi:MAG TPA: hypothetical protein VNW06_05930 [Cytophagaceae bacterium]|jgi:hypothetical protein|nr:hypothetical protein [Cytophagaceae bacterium]